MDPDRRTLHIVTRMFVEMLQNAKGGVLDLNDAAQALHPRKKRRIYDITNVLEGAGLIVKLSNSKIKWGGAALETDLTEDSLRLVGLQMELQALEQLEALLDDHTFQIKNSTKTTKESYGSLAYVSLKDLCDCYSGHSLLTIRAPWGAQLDVPIPKAVANTPPVYQIHLKSVTGPIDVLLLSKSLSVLPDPVILSFPPSKDLLKRARLASKVEELEGSQKQTKNIVSADVINKLMTSQGVGLADPAFCIFSALPICLGRAKTESEPPQ